MKWEKPAVFRPFSVLGTNYMRFINQPWPKWWEKAQEKAPKVVCFWSASAAPRIPSVPKPVVEPKAIQEAVVSKDAGRFFVFSGVHVQQRLEVQLFVTTGDTGVAGVVDTCKRDSMVFEVRSSALSSAGHAWCSAVHPTCRSVSPLWCSTTSRSSLVWCVAFSRWKTLIRNKWLWFWIREFETETHNLCWVDVKLLGLLILFTAEVKAVTGFPSIADSLHLWADYQGNWRSAIWFRSVSTTSDDLQAVFFIAGAPIWMSFYSIWLFEVVVAVWRPGGTQMPGVGMPGDLWTGAMCYLLHLHQLLGEANYFLWVTTICQESPRIDAVWQLWLVLDRVLWVTGFFYNNLSFARIRPALRQMMRQQKDLRDSSDRRN